VRKRELRRRQIRRTKGMRWFAAAGDGATGVIRPRSGSGGIPRGTRRATALEPSEVS
jgi:hypothetical protein